MVVLVRALFADSTRRALVVALASALCGIVSCRSEADTQRALANGDDPMIALDATEVSTRYVNPFWLVQSDSNTALWQRAKIVCAENAVAAEGQKVNCAPVLVVAGTETVRHPERRSPRALRL